MTTQWADPPPIGGPQSPTAVWVERLRPLMDSPGKWAVVKSGTPSAVNGAANQLRLRQRHLPPGQWEFTVRTFRRGVHVGDMNVAQLYARYLGPGDEYHIPGLLAGDAQYDDDGYRTCPECGDRLRRAFGRGPWPKRCSSCWRVVKSKWSRKKYGS